MRFWLDTEFIEDSKTIDLISIGVVSEDGREYYAENVECNFHAASPWVRENVLPHLLNTSAVVKRRAAIAADLVRFMGDKPEIWADYGAYDWVVVCQLFGTMMDLPKGWPMFCRDVQQLREAVGNLDMPKPVGTAHNALDDARNTFRAWRLLTDFQASRRA